MILASFKNPILFKSAEQPLSKMFTPLFKVWLAELYRAFPFPSQERKPKRLNLTEAIDLKQPFMQQSVGGRLACHSRSYCTNV